MTTIAVIGLGAMGLGITQVYAAAGFSVFATDANTDARASAQTRLADALTQRVTAGKMTPADQVATLARVHVVPDLKALATADLVVEAIIENKEAKTALLRDLETVLSPSAILATNTSSLGVGDLGLGLTHPERLIGLHFFNPPPAMRLVELVSHPKTHPIAAALARQVTEAAGKTVIACADSPGFVVNRCARPYYGEAMALLEEGRSAADIDGAMLAAGYRLGPFALIDLIGSDINLAATESIYQAFGRHPRYFPFTALRRRVLSGHLGRKSGIGFLFPKPANPAPADADAIVRRIEATLVNEAAWLLASGGPPAQDIDTAIRLGLNFPRGPFEMLEHHGPDRIRQTLVDLARSAPANLAGRYDLAPLLQAD
jgi:3-hydroxybutyryl-CoA dehydrogenase